MTGRDLVSASLRLIGAIASGDSMAAQEATDGLSALNRMLASWSTESLLVNAKVREVFPLVPGQQAYTMGVTGNFNTSRPLKIEAALIQVTGSSQPPELALQVLNMEQFASIVVKGVTSSIPTYLYCEGTNPLETLNLWPIPSTLQSIVLYSWKPLSTFPDINTDVVFPPGYDEALIYNLAIRLAPEYGKSTPGEVMQIATDAKAAIKRMNTKPQYLQIDDGIASKSGGWNWMTGET